MVSILTPGGYRHYLSDYEPASRVSPILAAYMAMFYFGSVARYRPLDLEKMREGKFAWVIEEMLATQGEQFLYLSASELLERKVMKPWAIQQGGPIG
jgi:YaaC-like Protein